MYSYRFIPNSAYPDDRSKDYILLDIFCIFCAGKVHHFFSEKDWYDNIALMKESTHDVFHFRSVLVLDRSNLLWFKIFEYHKLKLLKDVSSTSINSES